MFKDVVIEMLLKQVQVRQANYKKLQFKWNIDKASDKSRVLTNNQIFIIH